MKGTLHFHGGLLDGRTRPMVNGVLADHHYVNCIEVGGFPPPVEFYEFTRMDVWDDSIDVHYGKPKASDR